MAGKRVLPSLEPLPFWDVNYVPSFPSAMNTIDYYNSGIDFTIIYNGLKELLLPVAGETTNLKDLEWIRDFEIPDYRLPFHTQVDKWVDDVNAMIVQQVDDTHPYLVQGVGPTRKQYFVSRQVIERKEKEGFFATERQMRPHVQLPNKMDIVREYPGFQCSGRHFPVYQAPHFTDPHPDHLGPRNFQIGVTDLSLEARLHSPRLVWPAYRTNQEREDISGQNVREDDCLLCLSFRVLLETGKKRFRRKQAQQETRRVTPSGNYPKAFQEVLDSTMIRANSLNYEEEVERLEAKEIWDFKRRKHDKGTSTDPPTASTSQSPLQVTQTTQTTTGPKERKDKRVPGKKSKGTKGNDAPKDDDEITIRVKAIHPNLPLSTSRQVHVRPTPLARAETILVDDSPQKHDCSTPNSQTPLTSTQKPQGSPTHVPSPFSQTVYQSLARRALLGNATIAFVKQELDNTAQSIDITDPEASRHTSSVGTSSRGESAYNENRSDVPSQEFILEERELEEDSSELIGETEDILPDVRTTTRKRKAHSPPCDREKQPFETARAIESQFLSEHKKKN